VALPSAVTLGSLAFVLAAGGGYVALSTASAHPASSIQHALGPTVVIPSKPISVPQHSSTVHHPKPAVPDVLVVVFNNTGVDGVAEREAAILQGAGWSVAATDDWYGNIPENTVYYPPALRSAAGKLAKVLHITRLHAAVAPMQFDRLTVIIATP
jgi:LytR cell envelope-related transcriptional attenuator